LNVECIYSAFGGGKTQKRTDSILKKMEDIDKNTPSGNSKLAFLMSRLGAEYLSGNFYTSYEYYDESRKLAQESKNIIWHRNTVDLFHCWSMYWLGMYRLMAIKVADFISEAEKRGDKYVSLNFRMGIPSTFYLAKDQPDELIRLNEESIKQCPEGTDIQEYSADKAIVMARLYKQEGEAAFKVMAARIKLMKKARMFQMVQVVRLESLHLFARAALLIGTEEKLVTAEKAARSILKENMSWANPLANLVLAGISAKRKKSAEAIKLLEGVIKDFDELKMAGFKASVQYQLGKLTGGENGNALIDEAYQWAESEEVVNPEKIFEMDAPGFSKKP
jgi:hypothetical protein